MPRTRAGAWQAHPGGIPLQRRNAYDLTGNSLLDIVAGPYWLENLGDGTSHTHETVTGFRWPSASWT